MFDTALAQLAIVATFVTKVIDFVKPVYQGTKYQKYIDLGASLVLSGFLCVSWGVDVFAVAGLHFTLTWLGAVFTGVLSALGSNVLHDVLELIKIWKDQTKVRG